MFSSKIYVYCPLCHKINASLNSFQTDLVIFDGPNRNSKEIGKVFGKRHPDLLKSISSTRSSLLIAFNTFKFILFDLNGASHLIIKASIKYNKIDSNCQKWLNYTSKSFLSPNYPNEYNNNIKCTWLISAKFGSYLELAFKFIEVNQPAIIELILNQQKSLTYFLKQLEYGFDYLKIYNGGNDYSNQIAELTGIYNRTKVSIPRNQMFIVFDTNNSTTKKGFKAFIHEHSMYYVMYSFSISILCMVI